MVRWGLEHGKYAYEAKDAYGLDRQEQITENMFCAESPVQDQPVDTCFGDSGAGLTIRNGLDKLYLLGIASWGVGCAKQGYAGVYTRVANYTDWIDSYISPQKVVEINDQKNNKNIVGEREIMVQLPSDWRIKINTEKFLLCKSYLGEDTAFNTSMIFNVREVDDAA